MKKFIILGSLLFVVVSISSFIFGWFAMMDVVTHKASVKVVEKEVRVDAVEELLSVVDRDWQVAKMCSETSDGLEEVTFRYPVDLGLDETVLSTGYCYPVDPGIHNYILPIATSSDILAAELMNDKKTIFYITWEANDASTKITLHKLDTTTGQSIQVAEKNTQSPWIPGERGWHGGSMQYAFSQFIPVQDGVYYKLNWFDNDVPFDPVDEVWVDSRVPYQQAEVRSSATDTVVHIRKCDRQLLNGVRSRLDISPNGTFFVTQCPDGLFIGDLQNKTSGKVTVRKLQLDSVSSIEPIWPIALSNSLILFGDGSGSSLAVPVYIAETSGSIVGKLDTSWYGGY